MSVQLSGGWCAGNREPFPTGTEHCYCETSSTEKLIQCFTAWGKFYFLFEVIEAFVFTCSMYFVFYVSFWLRLWHLLAFIKSALIQVKNKLTNAIYIYSSVIQGSYSKCWVTNSYLHIEQTRSNISIHLELCVCLPDECKSNILSALIYVLSLLTPVKKIWLFQC